MAQQQMTGLVRNSEMSILEDLVDERDVIPDRSANVFAAVIDDTRCLPDDGNKARKRPAAARKGKDRKAFERTLRSIRAGKDSLALLQEENTLWLR